MSNKTAFVHISKLYSLEGGVRIKEQLDEPKIYENAYLIVKDGLIEEVGSMDHFHGNNMEIVDVEDKIMIPGFVDAHSHLVFGGSRVHEYAMKIKGASYLDIYNAGGGIHSTVKATRLNSFEELYQKAEKTVFEMMKFGVTTLEAKSGYGLDKETELKQLKVVKKLNEETPMDIVSTFMPAHALPKEYKDAKDFLNEMIEHVLPVVVEENLAEYMDCFLEKDVFTVEEASYILEAGKKVGLKIKIHIDEIEDIGGTDIAVKLQATSVEHCMVTSVENMKKLKDANVTAVILPATSFNLCKDYANVSAMKECGLVIALSNDYNPGSSPCTDSLWMARIASRGCRLTPNEVLAMMTINSAKAIDRDHLVGSLEKGKQADFILMDVESFDDVIANLGASPISSVYKKGIKVV